MFCIIDEEDSNDNTYIHGSLMNINKEIDNRLSIDFISLDVEGAEVDVLKCRWWFKY